MSVHSMQMDGAFWYDKLQAHPWLARRVALHPILGRYNGVGASCKLMQEAVRENATKAFLWMGPLKKFSFGPLQSFYRLESVTVSTTNFQGVLPPGLGVVAKGKPWQGIAEPGSITTLFTPLYHSKVGST